MNEINWIVWDSCAYGAYGWEESHLDTCGELGFSTLAEAWKYYKENQGKDCFGHNNCRIKQWCSKPASVIARSLNVDHVIDWN